MRALTADYVVVGAGAAGMAFADAMVSASDAEIIVVDRRQSPGGHWVDAYPFVRLHQPSAYYGVNSLALGTGDTDRASGAEICAYYERVMQQMIASGKVRYFPASEWIEPNRIVSSGEVIEVTVRKKVVDGRYLEPAIPAQSPPPFEIADGVTCIPVGELALGADGYVIIGAGKTAHDACTWLLASGVSPEAIQWIKPREAWFLNRAFAQGGAHVDALFEGISLQIEAAAQATSADDLFARLEAAGQLLRVDERITPTMFKGPTTTLDEIAALRRITNVVRLGHVRRIERDAIVLERGQIPTSPRHVHVHCAAPGLNPAPAVPIFAADRITLQPIRPGLIPFNAALVGFVEATRRDVVEANRLCPPNPLADVPLDWARGTLRGIQADYGWSKEPDLAEWLERSRLNASRGLRARGGEPRVQAATRRYRDNIRTALANLAAFT